MRCAVALLIVFAAGDGREWVRVQDQGKASLLVPKRAGDPLAVKLSETLTIVMRVVADAPLDVERSGAVRSSEGWHLELVGAPTTGPVAGTKQVFWEQTFKATPLQPGAQPLTLPAIEITVQDGAPAEVQWAPLALTIVTRVAKVDASEAKDLAPIEQLPPPAETVRPWWPWLFAALPPLALTAFILLRRRARPLPEPTPAETALRQLAAMTGLPTTTAADVERWHVRLSEVLRRYLEERFALPATRQTTPEFFAALATAAPLAASHQEMVGDLLLRCDLAKFARVVPAREECQRAVTLAREFVTALA